MAARHQHRGARETHKRDDHADECPDHHDEGRELKRHGHARQDIPIQHVTADDRPLESRVGDDLVHNPENNERG
jgi:hypothetical protein